MEMAPGNLLIILVSETKILLLKEPNNDLSAYFLFPLNLTSSVLFFLGVGDVVRESNLECACSKTLDVNVKSMFLTAKYGVPHMRKRGGGAIVNISSVQSIGAQKQVVAYSTSKGAINALTRAMAMDFAVDKIRVNSVLPGSVDTPLLRFAAETHKGNKTVDEVVAEWGSSHPIGRMGTIEDIAELVAFLASDRALFITGSDYVIDGGLMAQIPVILPEK